MSETIYFVEYTVGENRNSTQVLSLSLMDVSACYGLQVTCDSGGGEIKDQKKIVSALIANINTPNSDLEACAFIDIFSIDIETAEKYDLGTLDDDGVWGPGYSQTDASFSELSIIKAKTTLDNFYSNALFDDVGVLTIPNYLPPADFSNDPQQVKLDALTQDAILLMKLIVDKQYAASKIVDKRFLPRLVQ